MAGARLDASPRPRLEPPTADAPVTSGSPEDARPITFADLSLLGSDVSALIEQVFGGDPEEHPFEFPAAVRELDGMRVSVVGYMIPLDWEEEEVTRFMLVRDLAACCFGGIPRPDEWIEVRPASPTDHWEYVPVRVTGTLSVGLARDETGLLASAFQIAEGEASLER